MITNRKDLKEYLLQDKKMLGIARNRPRLMNDEIWRYEILLRRLEYATNCLRGPLGRLYRCWLKFRYHRLSVRLTILIPVNVFDGGLSIAHYGSIIVNEHARIGKNCRLQSCVTIGSTNGSSAAPVIGDNCYIGAGARVIGGITIADDVAIGANAVVVKDIENPHTTWAGVPARQVGSGGSACFMKSG